MPDVFDKNNILSKLRLKATAKGFDLNPDRSNLPPGVPTMVELLEVVAETLDEIFIKDQTKTGTIKAKNLKLGPTGLQQPVAYKNAKVKSDITTDPKFWTWMETFHGLLQAVYPEPGFGSPNVFATALKVLLAQKPTSITAKITQGSGSVKVTT